jgi:hypothetical protein
MHAGGSATRVAAARAIVAAGIACMGHVGLTPQSVSAIGGFRPQAQHSKSALETVLSAQVCSLNLLSIEGTCSESISCERIFSIKTLPSHAWDFEVDPQDSHHIALVAVGQLAFRILCC